LLLYTVVLLTDQHIEITAMEITEILKNP